MTSDWVSGAEVPEKAVTTAMIEAGRAVVFRRLEDHGLFLAHSHCSDLARAVFRAMRAAETPEMLPPPGVPDTPHDGDRQGADRSRPTSLRILLTAYDPFA